MQKRSNDKFCRNRKYAAYAFKTSDEVRERFRRPAYEKKQNSCKFINISQLLDYRMIVSWKEVTDWQNRFVLNAERHLLKNAEENKNFAVKNAAENT